MRALQSPLLMLFTDIFFALALFWSFFLEINEWLILLSFLFIIYTLKDRVDFNTLVINLFFMFFLILWFYAGTGTGLCIKELSKRKSFQGVLENCYPGKYGKILYIVNIHSVDNKKVSFRACIQLNCKEPGSLVWKQISFTGVLVRNKGNPAYNLIFGSSHITNPKKLNISSNIFFDFARKTALFCAHIFYDTCDHRTALILQKLILGRVWLCDSNKRIQIKDMTVCFRKTGLDHIIAISGMHLTVILGVTGVFSIFFVKRFRVWNLAADTLFIVFIIFVTGFRASVIRAGLMAVTAKTGFALKRKASLLNALLFSFIIQTVFNPALIFDLGFILSHAAVLVLCIKDDNPGFSKESYIFESLISLRVILFLIPIITFISTSIPFHAVLLTPVAGILTGYLIRSGLLLIFTSITIPALCFPIALFAKNVRLVSTFILNAVGKNRHLILNFPKIPQNIKLLIVFISIYSLFRIIKEKNYVKRGY